MKIDTDKLPPIKHPQTAPHDQLETVDESEGLDVDTFSGHNAFIKHIRQKFDIKNPKFFQALEKYIFTIEAKYQDTMRHLKS
jgi:hypothetical protein